MREGVPEFRLGDGRADYCLMEDARKPAVFIEVKAADEGLESHEKPLLEYAFHQGVEIAALTNGLSWWLSLPLIGGTCSERKFFVIDIQEQGPLPAAKRFRFPSTRGCEKRECGESGAPGDG